MKRTHWTSILLSLLLTPYTTLADTASEGIRAGLQLGYGLMNTKLISTTQPAAPALPGKDSSSVGGIGAIASFTVDYMMLLGHSDVIFGGELALNLITIKGKKNSDRTFPTALNAFSPADLTTSIQFSKSYDLTLKTGYMLRDSAVAYVKAGPSMGYAKARSLSSALNYEGSFSSKLIGLVLGVGAEFPLSDRVAIAGEYTYRRYPDLTHKLKSQTGVTQLSLTASPNASTFVFRVNYKLSAVDFSTTPPERKTKRRKRR